MKLSFIVNAKYYIAMFACLLVGAETANAQSDCLPAPAGMIAWWPGDGNTTDLIGGHNGFLAGGSTYSAGKVGQAFNFNGNSCSPDGWCDFQGGRVMYVQDDPLWTLGDSSFTIDLWVNFTILIETHIHGRYPFIAHDEGGGATNKWIFWYDYLGHNGINGPALRFHINSPSLGAIDTIYAPWSPTVDKWHHVAVTRDGADYALYIDGVQVATAVDTNTIPDVNAFLSIGGAEQLYTDGLIDEVEVFKRALSPEEIAAIYYAGSAGKCKETTISVFIDIKPGSYPNSINLHASGVIPVAILSTDTFSAANEIDPETLTLAGARVRVAGKSGKSLCHITDVNNDGRDDYLCQFENDLFAEVGDSAAVLEGLTLDGKAIRGKDTIRIVP